VIFRGIVEFYKSIYAIYSSVAPSGYYFKRYGSLNLVSFLGSILEIRTYARSKVCTGIVSISVLMFVFSSKFAVDDILFNY